MFNLAKKIAQFVGAICAIAGQKGPMETMDKLTTALSAVVPLLLQYYL